MQIMAGKREPQVKLKGGKVERSAPSGCIINPLLQAISEGWEGRDLRGLGCPGLTPWHPQWVEGGAAGAGAQWPALALAGGPASTCGCRSPQRCLESLPTPVCVRGPQPRGRAALASPLLCPSPRIAALARSQPRHGGEYGLPDPSQTPGADAAGKEGAGMHRDSGAIWELLLSGGSFPLWGGCGARARCPVRPGLVNGLILVSPPPLLAARAPSRTARCRFDTDMSC